MKTLEKNLLYRVGNYGMVTSTLENSCEPHNLGRRRADVPKLEGTIIGFGHVPGRAS